MGSLVIDAATSFFSQQQSHHAHPHISPSHPQHALYRETPRTGSTSKRSRSQSNSGSDHMSEPAQRAPSSSAAQRHSDHVRSGEPRAASQRSAPRPQSPTLGASTLPPPPADESQTDAQTDSIHTTPSSRSSRPRKIKVRDLDHIRTFASENMRDFSEIRSRSRSRSRAAEDNSPEYEISEMKVEHIIEMVAGLLTKITTTNDKQHEHLHRAPPSMNEASHLNQQTTSVLAFHGKNVPSITILSYLSRINKYCPTSYEVFLSLLVYFDRMTERVNAGPMQCLHQANQQAVQANAKASRSGSAESLDPDRMEGVIAATPSGTQQATPPYSGGLERPSERGIPGTPHSRPNNPEADSLTPPPPPSSTEPSTHLDMDPFNLSHFFVVDSFNIHRLVIAGVTCASKFFSDIFYTNSRYAKVSFSCF